MQFDPTLYVITDSTYHTTETLLRAVDDAVSYTHLTLPTNSRV